MIPEPELITPLKFKKLTGKTQEIKRVPVAKGEELTVISMRNAMFCGLSPRKWTAPRAFTYHKLVEKESDGCITSDCPQELYTQWMGYRHCFGNVLVGGLGLGMAPVLIANAPGVKSVTVIEYSRENIKLVEPQLPETKAPIITLNRDLFVFLQDKSDCMNFDSAYFDIWSPTGEGAWNDYIIPLRRLVLKRFNTVMPVGCWLEEEMKSQIAMSISTSTGTDHLFGNPKVPQRARQGWIDSFRPLWVFQQATKQNPKKKVAELSHVFINYAGTQLWEMYFGKLWDSFKKK